MRQLRKKQNMKLKSTTIRLSEGDMKKLVELAKGKYRGVSRSQAIRLLIEDGYKELGKISEVA